MQTNWYEKNKLLLRLLLLRNLKKAAPKGGVHDLLVREVNSWILKHQFKQGSDNYQKPLGVCTVDN